MLRLNLLLIINIFLSGFLSINILKFNPKIENINNSSKKNWIYNYSENYLFIKNNNLFSIKNNKLLWKTKINNNDFNILEFQKEKLIILLSNNNIKLLSSENGKILWEINLDKYDYKLPSFDNENIFLLGDRKIYFIDIKSGNIKKIIKLKDEQIKLEEKKNKKKEVSVKIVYLKSDKKYIDTNKYFFSLYKLDIQGNLNNKFLLEKSKKDEYFHKSDNYFINKENTLKVYEDKTIFNLNEIITYKNNIIIYKRDSKVYSFDIIKNTEAILYDGDIQNIYISDNKYILFTKNKIICRNLTNLWEYKLESNIDHLNIDQNNIIFNDGLYKLKSINIDTGKLNWVFNSSSIVFSFFVSGNNLYLTTALADLKSKNYIYQININTGEFNWSFEFPEDEWFYTVIEKNKSVFIVNTKSITASR